MLRRAYLGGAVLAIALAAGCSPPAMLTSQMTDPVLRDQITQHFSAGMTMAQVEGELDELHISSKWRLKYPAKDTRPEVLLARLYPPGGAWPGDGDNILEFVDVSFIFDPRETLQEWKMFRDGVRYFNGGVVSGPTRPTLAPVRDFPSPIPPPKDPLEGAS